MASNRDRLYVQPLGTSRRLGLIERLAHPPAGAVRLAEIDNADHGNTDPRGWLIRTAAGTYAILLDTGAVRSVDQRKAAAAADFAARAPSPDEGLGDDSDVEQPAVDEAAEAAELAHLVKGWRDEIGMPASRAAQLLGIPPRTLNGIEQGRGFRYTRLLVLAIQAFRSTPD